MTEYVKSNTRILTKQVVSRGETVCIDNTGFLLTDVIISNNSKGEAALVMKDDERTHIIKMLMPGESFNHSFSGGWVSWDVARLSIEKESGEGEVNVAVGYVKSNIGGSYNQWVRR